MSTSGAKNKRTGEFEFHEQKPVSVGRNRDKKIVALCGTLVILLVFAVIQVGLMYMAYRSEANAKNALQAEINRYEKIVGKDKLDHGAAGVDDAVGMGVDHHAFHAVSSASGSQVSTAFHFDDAHTAATGLVFKFHSCQFKIAKGRNMDTGLAGSFQNGGAFFDLNLFVVNCYINHSMSPPLFYLTEMALNLQPLIQAPHLMHLVVSITIEGSLWPGAM